VDLLLVPGKRHRPLVQCMTSCRITIINNNNQSISNAALESHRANSVLHFAISVVNLHFSNRQNHGFLTATQ